MVAGKDVKNILKWLEQMLILFIGFLFKVAKEELSRECDYELEATNQKRFRKLLSDAKGFYVPMVIDELSSKRVLTTELISGTSIIALFSQCYVMYLIKWDGERFLLVGSVLIISDDNYIVVSPSLYVMLNTR